MYESVFTSLKYKREKTTSSSYVIYNEGLEARDATDEEVAESKRRETARYERSLKRFCGASSTATSTMYLGTATALGFNGAAAGAGAGDGAADAASAGGEELAECFWESASEEQKKEADRQASTQAVDTVLTGRMSASSERLFTFSQKHRTAISLSDDLLAAELKESTERVLVYGSRGFSRGIHYWEVTVDKCNHGSMYIGVARGDGSMSSRNWHDLGFESYRATLSQSGETPYGKYYRGGDVMGVLLDCEKGQVSFLREGHEFYLQHPAAVNMGVAFKHVRSEGSSHEPGMRTSTLYYPVFGFSKKDDKITIRNSKWLSMPGEAPQRTLTSLVQTPALLQRYTNDLLAAGDAIAASGAASNASAAAAGGDGGGGAGGGDGGDENKDSLEFMPAPPPLVSATSSMYVDASSKGPPLPRWVIEEAYELWKGVYSGCLGYMSRAGRLVRVNPTRTAVERVGGGPGLMPGDRVKVR